MNCAPLSRRCLPTRPCLRTRPLFSPTCWSPTTCAAFSVTVRSRRPAMSNIFRMANLTPAAEITTLSESPTTLVLDGGGGLGYFPCHQAATRLIAKAQELRHCRRDHAQSRTFRRGRHLRPYPSGARPVLLCHVRPPVEPASGRFRHVGSRRLTNGLRHPHRE